MHHHGRPEPSAYQPRLSVWGHVWRFLVCLGLSLLGWVPIVGMQSDVLRLVDVVLGVVAFVLVLGFRRRWPVPVAVLVSVMGAGSALASGPAALALVSVATRRRWTEIALVGSVGFAASQFLITWQPGSARDPFLLVLGTNVVATAALIAWGLYVGSRRELLWTLRRRAENAEAERDLRVSQARATERAAIAREMHDVLAHRISQIAMHAGAVTFREDLGPAEVRASLGVIQEKAHEALTDLRVVLGVLRDEDADAVLPPQPTLVDVPDLVDGARAGGATVVLHDRVVRWDGAGEPVEPPAVTGRTVYRIVQEGLTNAGKHAPGATVQVVLDGSPDDGLTVTVSNPLGFARGRPAAAPPPGAGLGLVGLAERAELRGGRLDHRREADRFVLRAWIPWSG